MNSLYLTRPRGKIFLRSITYSTSWSDYLLVHLFAFFDFLPKRLMFPQILRSTHFDTPCLQQTRKKKTLYDCLFFEKILQGACAEAFSRPTLLGFHANATLRRSQNNGNVGTCWAKSLTSFKLYATSANIVVVPCKRTQQVTILLGPTMLGAVGQQCCVRLHGPLQ